MRSFLKYLFGVTAGLLLAAVLLFVAFRVWTTRLGQDAPDLVRPTYQRFEMGNGAADGSSPPAANGYLVDGDGEANILPPMPPEKPMDVHTAANYRKDAALKNCFWPGPRGRSGVFSNDVANFNVEDQFADTATTYIPVAFILPEGATLVMKGQFPHIRHWNFHTYSSSGIPADELSDIAIEPDAGHENPFRVGARRDANNRNYTLNIVSGTPPQPRPKNTLFTYYPAGQQANLILRNYVPDHSADYLGAVPLPTMELHTADGKVLEGQAVCDAIKAPAHGKQIPRSLSPRVWLAASHMPWVDSKNVGAVDAPVRPLMMFFSRPDLAARIFAPALARAEPKQEGGWWSNLVTRYGLIFLSRNFGKVYVMTAKMPRTPKTWHGDAENDPNIDMRYMSVCTAGGLSAGTTPDCIYDEQLLSTVDPDTGRFDIVVSREADRPSNATEACGMAWLEAGNGDNVPGGSPDYMAVINRHTEVSENFKHSWFSVTKAGSEKQVMGDYLPQVINMKEKAAFEALGCPVDKKRLHSMLNP
jgi:hypothetical protein